MDRKTLLILTALLAAGCSSKPRVVVASKNFTESVLIGEIVAQHLERRNIGLEVDRKLNLGGTLLAHEALRNGSIHLFPEYTGTALTAVLKKPVLKDAKAVLDQVRDAYRPWGLDWLPPLGFNNSFAMVVRTPDAREQNLKTMSDAARRAAPWRLGVGYEFTQRPDGLAGLVQSYGLRIDGQPISMDLGLLYQALSAKKADMVSASATDGMLSRPEFAVLEDDRRYFPPYECALVVRRDILDQNPKLRAALEELSGRFPEQTMRRLNAAVDVDHRPLTDVAREFLNQWK